MKLPALLCILLAVVQQINHALADYFEECDGMEDGSYVASSVSCTTYIYCMGEDSLSGECDAGQYFDSVESVCDDEENVYCSLDASEEPEIEPAEPVTSTTSATTTTTVAGGVTTTPDTFTIPPVIKDTCPPVDDPNQIVLMASSQSCSDYYLCYHGHANEMHCTNHLHFNIQTGKCDFPENVQCLIDRPNAHKCLPHMTDFFPHPEKCNYFYYCVRGFLTVQQCPFYYGWDIERRSCVQISQAKCFNNAKRI